MLSTPAFGKPRPACLATNEAIAYAEAIDSLPLAHSTTVARPMTLPPRTRASEAVDPEGHLTPYLELANSPTIHTETKRLYDEAFRLMAERDLAAKRYEFLAAKKSPADPVQHAKDLAAAEAAYFQKRAEYDANQRLLGRNRAALRLKELHDKGKILQVITQMDASQMHALNHSGEKDVPPWGDEAPPLLLLLKPDTVLTRVYGQDAGMFGGFATFPSRAVYEPRTNASVNRNRLATPHGDYENTLTHAVKFTFAKPLQPGEDPTTQPVLAWYGTTGPIYPTGGEVRGAVRAPNGDQYASETLGSPGGGVQVIIGNGRWKYYADGSEHKIPA
ncbi:MAG: hypothetical protein KDD51_16115, partial [Bdellovibrionales bacterium]|nr:hypothetical protein [Bdellovibrionales bacterium]